MRKYTVIILFSMAICVSAWAADEFDGVKCGTSIAKAVMGKRSSNERVVLLEKRHSDLGLKDLGGLEVSDRLFLGSWRICGNEYAELIDTQTGTIRDVLQVPAHSLQAPESFDGICQAGGKQLKDAVIAILDNSEGRKPPSYPERIMLPARIAWRIDERQERFVPISTQGLSCAISTSIEDMKQ